MYRSLLVPLDGSPFGEHALPLALSIARRSEAALNVAQVHEPLTAMYADSIAPGIYEAEVALLGQERAYLDGIVKRLTSVSSVRVTSTLLERPLIAETLNSHAGSTGADLIVMTTHGRGPLSRFWLGSVADEMIRRATPPILLVRPQEAAPDFTVEQVLRHVLIPLDGSALAEQVLEAAVALGGLMQSDYTLVRIYGPAIGAGRDSLSLATAGVAEPSAEQLRAEALDYLDVVAERLKGRGSSIQTHAALGRYAAGDILDAAQRVCLSN